MKCQCCEQETNTVCNVYKAIDGKINLYKVCLSCNDIGDVNFKEKLKGSMKNGKKVFKRIREYEKW